MADSAPHPQKVICDLTVILSLIIQRAPELLDEDNEAPNADSLRSGELDVDLEMEGEQVNEAEVEAEFEDVVGLKDTTLADIKQRSLDRLAEVLARFKTAKGSRSTIKRNPDAKHVTSVILVEDVKNKTGTFLCAKNEGLDAVDLSFLERLESLLKDINQNGKQTTVIFLRP